MKELVTLQVEGVQRWSSEDPSRPCQALCYCIAAAFRI